MSDHQLPPPPLGTLTTEQFRQRLAGVLDPISNVVEQPREEIRKLAIFFAASLPKVFGESLDRLTLWDRIASGLSTAYAKTQSDHELYVSEVLRHIHAEPKYAANCEDISTVLTTLEQWSPASREAWMSYLHTHGVVVLVYAKQLWEALKAERKAKKPPNAIKPETSEEAAS